MRPSLSVALELSAAVGLWLIAPGHASLLPSSGPRHLASQALHFGGEPGSAALGLTDYAARPDARPVAPLRDATTELTGPALESTQGQMDGFFSQHPYKCYQNRVASVGD